MFEDKEVKVLLSSAGNGKTYRLLQYFEEELKTRRPEEIGFVTFTRKGAEEGIHRICDKFRMEVSELPYVKTLHSLTFHALDLKSNQMFGYKDQKEFNKLYGYFLNRCEVNDGRAFPTKDSQYLDYYDLERSGSLTSRQMSEANIEVGYYNSLVRKYEQYKAEKCLVDFFDCLIKYVREGVPLPCKVVMVDECQDITALQWKVIEKAFANAEKVYMAGDSKQAIFTYAGARPDILIDFAKKFPTEDLTVSYRLPKSVVKLSNAIASFISEKAEKPAVARPENGEGSITSVSDVNRLMNFVNPSVENRDTSQWYILGRNKVVLQSVMTALEEKLIPYWTRDGFFMGGEIMKRLTDYHNFSLEGYKSAEKKKQFAEKFGITDFSVPFTDTNLFTEGRKWIYQAYIEKYGLLQLQEMCKWSPQVLVSTVHTVKGGECTRCAVLLDMTRRTQGNIFKDIDEELRVLYVAVTRTKQDLFLVDSKGGNGYDKILQAIKEENGLTW